MAAAETFCTNVTLSEAYADRPIYGYPYLFAIDFTPSTESLKGNDTDSRLYYYDMENRNGSRQLPWLERTITNERYEKTPVTEEELRQYWQFVEECRAPAFQVEFENGTEKFFMVHWSESQSPIAETASLQSDNHEERNDSNISLMGIGMGIAAIVAFLTLRKRK